MFLESRAIIILTKNLEKEDINKLIKHNTAVGIFWIFLLNSSGGNDCIPTKSHSSKGFLGFIIFYFCLLVSYIYQLFSSHGNTQQQHFHFVQLTPGSMQLNIIGIQTTILVKILTH